MDNHSNEGFIDVLHFNSNNHQENGDNELLKAQVYLAKGEKGDKWWSSLAVCFAHLSEGNERIEFVEKYLSDKSFGKRFLSTYTPGETYKIEGDAGRTPLATECAVHQVEIRGKGLTGIISYFNDYLNGNASESLLAHLLVSQSIGQFCKGKTLPFLLSQATQLFDAGLIDETLQALKYGNLPFGNDDILLFEFIKGGFNDSWKGVETPVTKYMAYVPKETLDRLADYDFDRYRLNFYTFSSEATDLVKAGYGHHTIAELSEMEKQEDEKRSFERKALEHNNAQSPARQENMTEAEKRQYYWRQRKAWEEGNSPTKRKEREEALKKRFMQDARINRIVSFVTTGEMDDGEDTELSDVLQNVLDDFSEDEQNFIFQALLKETTGETNKYVIEFLEAKMEEEEEIPYETARYLVMECDSRAAMEYFASSFDDWDSDGDLMLVMHLINEGLWDDGDYDNLRNFLEDCPNPDEMNWLENEFSEDLENCPYEAAVAYYHNADFEKALHSLINGEDGVDGIEDMYGIEGSGCHFLIKILNGILEDHPHDFDGVIRDVIGIGCDDICKICVKEKAYSMALRMYSIGELENEYLLKEILANIQQADDGTTNGFGGLMPTDYLWWKIKARKNPDLTFKEAVTAFRDGSRKVEERVSAGQWLVNNGHITATDDFRWIFEYIGDESLDSQEKYVEQHLANDPASINILIDRAWKKSDTAMAIRWMKRQPTDDNYLQRLGLKGDYEAIKDNLLCNSLSKEDKAWTIVQLVSAMDKINDFTKKLSFSSMLLKDLHINNGKIVHFLVEHGDADATFELYKQDHSIKTLWKAASLGSAEAQYQLGLHLLKLHDATPMWKKAVKVVKGTKTNKQKAKEWFAKAAKQGHKEAIKMLK